MYKKAITSTSTDPQSAAAKSGEFKLPSFLVSASQDPFPNTKQKRERSPVRMPDTSLMSTSHHFEISENGAPDYLCSCMGTASATTKSTSTISETETGGALNDCNKSPTRTKPRKKVIDYYESLDNTIAASINSVGSSPRSRTFWEGTGAIPKYLPKDSAKTSPKVLPPFQKKATVIPKIMTELFSDVSHSVGESVGQRSEEPPKNAPSSSIETKSSRNLPKSRSDFEDDSESTKFNCLDFQDYKRTVNNKQKGAESDLRKLLPEIDSVVKDGRYLAAKIEEVKSEVCDMEKDLRIQNDKLKYLIGRSMSTIDRINDIQDKFQENVLEYTPLPSEDNYGIDRRMGLLLSALCGLSDKKLSRESNYLIRDAVFEAESRMHQSDSRT